MLLLAFHRKIFEVLIELADSPEDVTLFTPHASALAAATQAVVSAAQLEPALRQFALELLVTVIVHAPQLLASTKHKGLLSAALGVSCDMIMDLPENPLWGTSVHTTVAEDDADGNTTAGQFAFYRITHVAKALTVRKLVVPTVTGLLESPDWRARFCALVGFVSLQNIATLDQFPLKRIVLALDDAHPRVRCAALDAVRGLAESKAPRFQATAHAVVLPPLLTSLEDARHPKVQLHACEALYSFLGECQAGVLAPSAQDILQRAMTVVQTSPLDAVRREAVAIVGAVAAALQEDFAPYYSAVIPVLKALLLNNNAGSNGSTGAEDASQASLLRCRAIETITLIGTSVGKELFAPDATDLVHYYLSLHSSTAANSNSNSSAGAAGADGGSALRRRNAKSAGSHDDETAQFMLMAMVRVCSVVGAEFAPLLPIIVPQVLERAARAARRRARRSGAARGARNLKKVTFDENGEVNEAALPGPGSDNDDDDDGDSDGEGAGAGAGADDDDDNPVLAAHKATSLALTAIEEEANLLSMLSTFCTELKELYAPYARATLAVCALYLEQSAATAGSAGDAGRLTRTATVLLPDLVRSVFLAATLPGLAEPATESDYRAIFTEALSLLTTALAKEEDDEAEQVIIGAVFLLCEAATPDAVAAGFGSLEAVATLVEALMQCADNRITVANDRTLAVAVARARRAAAAAAKTAAAGGVKGGKKGLKGRSNGGGVSVSADATAAALAALGADPSVLGAASGAIGSAKLARMTDATLAARNRGDETVAESALQAVSQLGNVFGGAVLTVAAPYMDKVLDWAGGERSRPEVRRLSLMFLHTLIEHIGAHDLAAAGHTSPSSNSNSNSNSNSSADSAAAAAAGPIVVVSDGAGAAALASVLPAVLSVAHGRLVEDSAYGRGPVVERAAYLVAVAVRYCAGVLLALEQEAQTAAGAAGSNGGGGVVGHLVEGLVRAQQQLRGFLEATYGADALTVAGARNTAAATAGTGSAAGSPVHPFSGDGGNGDDEDDEDDDDDDDDDDGGAAGLAGAAGDDGDGDDVLGLNSDIDPELEMLHFALDNITAALGNIAVLLSRADAAALWLAALPMQLDYTEADWTYKLLCEQVAAQNPVVVGADGRALPRVVELLAVAAQEEGVDEEVRLRAAQLRDGLVQAMSQ